MIGWAGPYKGHRARRDVQRCAPTTPRSREHRTPFIALPPPPPHLRSGTVDAVRRTERPVALRQQLRGHPRQPLQSVEVLCVHGLQVLLVCAGDGARQADGMARGRGHNSGGLRAVMGPIWAGLGQNDPKVAQDGHTIGDGRDSTKPDSVLRVEKGCLPRAVPRERPKLAENRCVLARLCPKAKA